MPSNVSGPREFGIVSRETALDHCVSQRTKDWLKFKNPTAPAVRREAEEEWGKR
jgi:hypothetical protein